jgi:hypothetical protein
VEVAIESRATPTQMTRQDSRLPAATQVTVLLDDARPE